MLLIPRATEDLCDHNNKDLSNSLFLCLAHALKIMSDFLKYLFLTEYFLLPIWMLYLFLFNFTLNLYESKVGKYLGFHILSRTILSVALL